MSEPQTVKVRAIDVVPYRWAVWSSIAGSEPFENRIVGEIWSTTEVKIWFMLDSHNFLDAGPDEMLDLIPVQPKWEPSEADERHRLFVASRPDTDLIKRKRDLEQELASVNARLRHPLDAMSKEGQ